VRRVLVLCYHAVSEEFPAALSVTPATLERQLELLMRRGWSGYGFTEAITAPGGGRRLVVTFDDAYASVGALAAPILERLGLPGTLFVPTDWPGAADPMRWPGIDRWLGTAHEHELVPLGWDEIGALSARGWEIGAHTCSHPHLTRLRDEDLARELVESRAEVQRRLGGPCTSMAYPYGDTDARVVRAVHAAGYTTAAALPGPFHRPRALEWPRVGVYHGDAWWLYRVRISRAFGWLRASRVLEPLAAPRRRGPARRRTQSEGEAATAGGAPRPAHALPGRNRKSPPGRSA
jgi:peptidoglycan/xylan/chitin deacetylase (PgdA/CDA1 family)